MLILSIKTDSEKAELGLYENEDQIDNLSFEAKRELADKIHNKIKELLSRNSKELKDLKGIIAFKGPGSFTGLRIGLTVANALSYSLNIPIRGAAHEDWPNEALNNLISSKNEKQAMPFYGAEPNITKAKK